MVKITQTYIIHGLGMFSDNPYILVKAACYLTGEKIEELESNK